MDTAAKQSAQIVYACYYKSSRSGEQFVPCHTFSYQVAGSLLLSNGSREYPSKEGAFRFIRKNQLIKFSKRPPDNGEFNSLTLYLNEEMLRQFSMDYEMVPQHKAIDKPVWEISANPLLNSYAHSLIDYHENPPLQTERITELKLREAILLLLQAEPELKNVLFDFTDPHKIDLEEFMNRNYHFNVRLERFAYLSGRSLASFKRDFVKQFNTTPGRWLQQKRLEEAWYLITKKGKTASDIYIDLGFEDLSHFSYAFKRQFGKAPSKISVGG